VFNDLLSPQERFQLQRRKLLQKQQRKFLQATERMQAVQRDLGVQRRALKVEMARQERLQGELSSLQKVQQLEAAAHVSEAHIPPSPCPGEYLSMARCSTCMRRSCCDVVALA
jgi:hypothetical protein